MSHTAWVAIAALIVGAFVRALKTDGASAVLTRLAGRDSDNPVKINTRALPFVALGAGALSAGLDGFVAGDDWQTAVQKGVMASALAVFGHELGSGVPGVKKVLGVAFVVFFASQTLACTPQAWKIVDLLADNLRCAVANQNLPNDELLKRCAVRPENVERVLEVVGAAREESAAQANRAAAVARDEALREAMGGRTCESKSR